jgi:hypothetical protein
MERSFFDDELHGTPLHGPDFNTYRTDLVWPLHFLLRDENVVGDFKCLDLRNDGDRGVEDERGCRTFGCLSPEEATERETVIEEAARGLTKTAGRFLLQRFIDLDIAL